MALNDELLLTLRQIGADDIADGLENVADQLDNLEKSQEDVNKTSEKAVDANKDQKKSLLEVNAALDLFGKGINAAKDFAQAAIGDTMAYAKSVRDLSTNIGISVEETSKIIQAADDYGIGIGEVTSALQMMTKRGIAPSIDKLAAMADQFVNIQDPVKRAEVMTEAFGRSWTTLTPLLKEGGQALRDSADEAEKMGLVLSEKDVKAARQLEINLDNLNDRVEALKLKIGNALIPVLNDAATGFDLLVESVSKADSKEEEFRQTIIALSLRFGAESEQVKQAAQEMTNYLQASKVAADGTQAMADVLYGEYVPSVDKSRSSGDDLVEAILAEEAGMKRASDAAAIHDKFMKDLAVSQEAAAKAAGVATVAFLGTATSLQGANKLSDYAKVALAGLQQQLESGQITASQYSAAYQTLGINAGIVSKESLASTRGIELVNKAFADGMISAAEYSTAVAKIPNAAKDGVVTLKEVGLGSIETVRKSKQDMLDEAGNAAKDTVDKVSGSISTNMLKVSNAVGATKSLVNDLKTDLKTLSDTQIMIKYSFVLVGSTPLGGGGMGGRAEGGAVGAGVPYIIGEHGRETFVPQQAGIVIPNNVTNTNITNNITTDQMGVALAMARAQQMAAEARM